MTPCASASGVTAATKPPPSCPPMNGSSRLYRPLRWYVSMKLMPEYLFATSTPPGASLGTG